MLISLSYCLVWVLDLKIIRQVGFYVSAPLLLCGVIFMFTSGASAQLSELPGSVDPAKLQKRLEKPDIKPSPQDEIVPELPEIQILTPPHPADGFFLRGINVQNSMVLTPVELAGTYSDCLGLPAGLETLQFIAARITQLYRERGYFLSKAVVPEQTIKSGVASIAVIEGYISTVKFDGEALADIQGKDHFRILEDIAHQISAMRPLHGPSFEGQLLRINDLASVNLQTVMEALPPTEATPGAVGLTIKIDRSVPRFHVAVDNFGSRFVGPEQISVGAAFGSNLSAFDYATLSLLTTAQTKEAKAVSLGYALPLTANGTVLDILLAYSTLVPGHSLRVFDVGSKSYNAGIQVTQNILRSRRQSLSVSMGLDFENISSDIADTELYDDRIRAARIAVEFENNNNLKGTNSLGVTLSQGLDILGARETGSRNLSRATGHSDFTKVTARADRLQHLNEDWQIFAAASAQYAWDPLLSSEEFGYGGQAFGRGYDPSEIAGDHGIAAAVELRYSGLSDWQKTIFQPFVFYDIGKVWKPDAASLDQVVSGATAGIGVKFLHNNRTEGYFAAAVPLTKPAAEPPPYSEDHGSRLLFQIRSNF